MARTIVLTCDVPHACSNEDVTSNSFSFNGQPYSFDACAEGKLEFKASLEHWLSISEKVTGEGRGRAPGEPYRNASGLTYGEMKELRAWAEANGVPVAKRGKVRPEHIEEWKASLAEKATVEAQEATAVKAATATKRPATPKKVAASA